MLSLTRAPDVLRLTVSNMHKGDRTMAVHLVRHLPCISVRSLTALMQRSLPWCGRSAVMMLSMHSNRRCACGCMWMCSILWREGA